MSFITKRERVFTDYDLYDLPARNECKLKEYGSCTDTRAWSHFTTDKTEHLVEVIKRNNEKCAPKYVPTKVIVDTLMAPKNAEIERLKRKITQFEQIIAAYDQLDLNCAQRCEIVRAQEAIRAANKDLEDMCKCLDLDLSGYTEALDSEAYETGMSKADESDLSRGDDMCCEITTCEMWTKSVMVDSSRYEEKPADGKMKNDACTYARDTRVDELEGVIIAKDAKLSAMQNTIATKGRDVRQIDIKRKILYKMKVLEEFSMALIAPGTDEESKCSCYRAEVTTRIETTYALTSSESKQFQNKHKRSELVADIMDNKEMKELLDSDNLKKPYEEQTKDEFLMDNYSMNTENLNRLKTLQVNYDDLVACYENMTCERNCLITQCQRYNELEQELEVLKVQLREYNILWNEKEYYKNRSSDIDNLKQKFLILCDETSNMELELKAATVINKVKSCTIEELRAENILLEKKLNEASIAFEKEKSALLRQLQETDCKVMCQDQQIRSLSVHVDSFLLDSQNKAGEQDTKNSLILLTEIETLKDQINHLKDRLTCNEKEKLDTYEHFQTNLNLINELRQEVEDWKKSYEEVLDRNTYLQNFSETVENENRSLMKDVEDRKQAAENLKSMLDGKSQEINHLLSTIELKKADNRVLLQQLQKLESSCSARVEVLENNMQHVLGSLIEAKADSQELLQRMQKSDQKYIQPNNENTHWENEVEKQNSNNSLLTEEIKSLRSSLFKEKHTNVLLLQKIQNLSDSNNVAADNIDTLKDEKYAAEKSLQLERKTSHILEEKLSDFEDLATQIDSLKQEHQTSLVENQKLEVQLVDKNKDLDNSNMRLELQRKESQLERKASNTLVEKLSKFEDFRIEVATQMKALKQQHQKTLDERKILEAQLMDKNKEFDMLVIRQQLQRKESEELMDKVEMNNTLKSDLLKLNEEYKTLLSEKQNLKSSLDESDNHIKLLSASLDDLSKEKNIFTDKMQQIPKLEHDFNELQKQFDRLSNDLENKIQENASLMLQLQASERKNNLIIDKLTSIEKDNLNKEVSLEAMKKESVQLVDHLKEHDRLETEFEELKRALHDAKREKDKLKTEFDSTSSELQRLETENRNLKTQSENVRIHSKELQRSLENTRQELINSKSKQDSCEGLKKEIEEMRVENLKNQKKIRELRDKVDENEDIISSLNEDLMKNNQDIMRRDEKIAILQNHINELQHEIKILHDNLSEAVTTGEEISENKHRLMDQSLKKVEAHHSKATHNFKMELAYLQNEKKSLEEKMSVSQLYIQQSKRGEEENKHQLRKMKYEKEIFVTELKQLEIEAVGDSRLSPEECSLEDIIVSFDNIRKSVEAKLSKTSSLEQAIQSSSQLLLSKTDEAKRFIEREKQKILIEKEEAINDRLMLEKQMLDLKESLEHQITTDKNTIDDLQGEIANQKLVMKKITENTDSYVRKLEEEIQSMKDLYKNAKSDVDMLQAKIQMLSQDKDKGNKILESLHTSLETKTKEMAEIQDAFAIIKAKVFHNAEVQVNVTNFTKTTSTETSIEKKDSCDNTISMNEPVSYYSPNVYTSINARENSSSAKSKKGQSPNKNEVQVLTATVAPTIETLKSIYIDDKMNKLCQSPIETHSFQSFLQIQQTEKDMQLAENTSKDTKININLKPGSKKTVERIKTGLLQENGPSKESSLEQTMNSSYAISHDKELNRSSTTNAYNENDIFFINRDSNSSNGETSFNKYVDDSNQNYPYLHLQDNNLIVEAVTVPEHSLSYSANYQRQGHDVNSSSPVSPRERTQVDMKIKDTLNTNLAQPNYDTSMSVISTDMITDDVTIKLYPQHDMNRLADSASMQTQLIQSNTSNDDNQFSLTPDSNNDNKVILKAATEKNTKSYVVRSNQNDEAFNSKMTKDRNNSDKNKYYVKDDESQYLRTGINTLDNSDIINIVSKNKMSDKKSAKTFRLDLPSSFESVQFSEVIDNEDTILRKSLSEGMIYGKRNDFSSGSNRSSKLSNEGKLNNLSVKNSLHFSDKAVLAKTESSKEYEDKIKYLTKALEHMERDSKNRLETIKQQYDTNIKNIINEHNQGVKNLQSLHEETLNDIIRVHDNEVENLRSMSIEAMRKAEIVETENMSFKSQFEEQITSRLEKETTITARQKKRKSVTRDSAMLTKSALQAIDVKPRSRTLGPCTCSLDVNITDTIRNMFEQVDVEQRRTAEHTYLRFIANKILSGTVESLDAEELSFLHFKVCRTWKVKVSKEEALQKRIDSLESELLSKQQFTVQHIAELDRKVAQERSRLQEVREAVCCSPPTMPPSEDALGLVDKNIGCNCSEEYGVCELKGRPMGHLPPAPAGLRPRRMKAENHRAVLAQLCDDERVGRRPLTESIERRSYTLEPVAVTRRSSNRESPERRSFPHGSAERRPYTNEPPTRLRRSDRTPSARSHRK